MKIDLASRILAAAAIIVVLSIGCNKKTQPPSLHQRYQVSYLMDSGAFSAAATLRLNNGSTSITFPDRSILTANGIVDSRGVANDPGNFYWEMNHANDVTFMLKKDDNITLVNKVLRSQIDDVGFTIDSVLYVGDTMRATWVGAPLQQGENIGMALNRIDDTGSWSGASGELYGQVFTFDYKDTKALYPGTYNVSLSRTKTLPLQQPDGGAGGSITINLYVNKTVVVK